MKVFKMRKWRANGERGLTLPEVMISMVLCGFVMLGGGELFRQLMMASAHNTDTMTAVLQVQTSAFWLSQDAIQSMYVDRGANETGGFPLTLSWIDWGNNTYGAIYDYANMTDELERTLWEFTRIDTSTGEKLIIAEYLTPFDDGGTPGGNTTDRADDTGTRCYWDEGNATLKFEVTADVGFESQTRSYMFKPRSLN